MMAITKRIWMKPPTVYEVTTPRSHRMSNITAIVYNIGLLLIIKAELLTQYDKPV
jgi:hypothetical protein